MRESGRRLDLPRDDPLVRVATAPSEIDAEMLAEWLRQSGIDAAVRLDDDVRATTRAVGPLTWAYPVFVLESDYERARGLVDAIGHEEPPGGSPAQKTVAVIGSLLTLGVTVALILALMARSH
jgi:hypothetical protein